MKNLITVMLTVTLLSVMSASPEKLFSGTWQFDAASTFKANGHAEEGNETRDPTEKDTISLEFVGKNQVRVDISNLFPWMAEGARSINHVKWKEKGTFVLRLHSEDDHVDLTFEITENAKMKITWPLGGASDPYYFVFNKRSIGIGLPITEEPSHTTTHTDP